MQDGTLITQKSAGKFVTSASDWKLYNKDVPKVLKQYFDDGYKVVVFRYISTNILLLLGCPLPVSQCLSMHILLAM